MCVCACVRVCTHARACVYCLYIILRVVGTSIRDKVYVNQHSEALSQHSEATVCFMLNSIVKTFVFFICPIWPHVKQRKY